MRAYVRYYLKYTAKELDGMSTKELAEAFNDVLFVRARRSKFEPED